ncbi:MAG: TonB-dependent receptor [Alphaproteobacteria bacterium]|nr:TonB-dependent receptor [Alphaproteobacteria bacterium]
MPWGGFSTMRIEWIRAVGPKRSSWRLIMLAGTVFAVSASQAGLAFADAPETITVTARKRVESIQKVPVAIQAFTGKDVESSRAIDLTKIAEMATQVIIFPASSGSGASFNIRGIGSSSGDPGIDSSVTLDIDGMMINRGDAVRAGQFDLANVQILKGPQALFFGKNSPAGVISLQSADPGPEWEYIARLSYEVVGQEVLGEAIASGPINDKVGIRIAYRGRTSNGWLKNNSQPISDQAPYIAGYPYDAEPYAFPGATDKKLGAQDEHIARLTLKLNPTDRFEAKLKVLGDLYKDNGAQVNENIHCSGALPQTTGVLSQITLVDPYGDCKVNGVTSEGSMPKEIWQHYPGAAKHEGAPYEFVDTLLTTLAMNYTLDNFTISSQTGVHYYRYARFDNFDGTTFDQFLGYQTEHQTTVSQELRVLSTFDFPLNFMLGAFYENARRTDGNSGKIASVGAAVDANGVIHSENWSGLAHVREKTYSIFGQAIWKIVPDLELAGGARWTKVQQSADQQNTFVNPYMQNFFLSPTSPFLLPAGVVLDSTSNGNNVSPEVTLTWTPTDEFTLYGAYKTGYKAGGFSTNTVIVASATGQSLTFGPETSRGFEVGAKSSLMGGRLRTDLTLYRYVFKNLQVSAFDSATTSFQIRNAASARTEGVEFDADWLVTDDLTLKGGIGYNHARYTSFPAAPCFAGQTTGQGCVGGVQDLKGKPLVFAPDWSINAGFNYDTPVADGWKLGFTGDVVYSSTYQTSLADDARAEQPSYAKVNASVRLHSDDDKYEFAVIGRNLTDKYIIAGSADKPGGAPGDIFANIIRGREVILEATYHY